MGGGTGEESRWKASVPAAWAVQEKGKAALCGPCFGEDKKVRKMKGGKEVLKAVKDSCIILMV